MGDPRVPEAHRALKRMLANGPLAAVPKRPSDQQLLITLAASQFDPSRTYRENEVNETLKDWMQAFCEPHAVDHVTLRRMLVDSRFLIRTASGSDYRVGAGVAQRNALSAVDPARVLSEVLGEREARKHKHDNDPGAP